MQTTLKHMEYLPSFLYLLVIGVFFAFFVFLGIIVFKHGWDIIKSFFKK